ncbi:MAG: hypothetical protein IKF56_08560 [Eggerthellaceae bacterium]|nr:hypothetical protein [Eggerthellaceae bacterium]
MNVIARTSILKFGVLACIVALACGLIVGCANPAANNANSEQQANRAYMSQVNEIMEQLDKGLDSFVDAVSRGDIVNMRTQADNAFQILDKLAELEAPESLSDVQEKYVEGADKLRGALDAYITLYTDMSSASFDQSTYDDRIAQIQKLYDDGVKLMEEADEAAAGKQ